MTGKTTNDSRKKTYIKMAKRMVDKIINEYDSSVVGEGNN
jgi:hypothetical protein